MQPKESGMRIMLVEDDAALARGIASSLGSEGCSVDIVGSGEDALLIAPSEPYAAIILDLGLPDLDGIELLRRLRQSRVKTPILILTARDRIDDRVTGLDHGADDYMVKPFDPRELHSRVRALMRRAHGTPAPVLKLGALEFDRSSRTVLLEGVVVPLRARELAVLETLMTQPGRLVGKERLSASVFSFDDNVGINALEVYIGRLRRKLGDKGPAIRTVRGLGYMIEAH
ncbi:hypothetical protein L485_19930 [Sphingobium baderi LL03]|uniref:Transcriptional regulator n=2 Tax=Sphingobium baderi TaxID=1332080 RepID=T0G2W2_9SPHN|nr:hypothetical protein L485_19930 [Sphingobium baderi LL03]